MKNEQDAGPRSATFRWLPGKEHVKTFWLKDAGEPDRTMELLADFGINLPYSGNWIAPAKALVDGASIPTVLWSIVGAPFVGDYRRATVLHDVYCTHKTRSVVSRRQAAETQSTKLR